MSFTDSLLVAGILILIVFIGLFSLYLVMIAFDKLFSGVGKSKNTGNSGGSSLPG